MPNRADRLFVLRDPEGPLGFGQLEIAAPQCRRVHAGQVTAEQVTAVEQLRPVTEFRGRSPSDFSLLFVMRRGQFLDFNIERL